MSSFFDARVPSYRYSGDSRSTERAFVDKHWRRSYLAAGTLTIVFAVFQFKGIAPASHEEEEACHKACHNSTRAETHTANDERAARVLVIISAILCMLVGVALVVLAAFITLVKWTGDEYDPAEALQMLGSIEGQLEKNIFSGVLENVTDETIAVLEKRNACSSVAFFYSRTISWAFGSIPEGTILGIMPSKDKGMPPSDTTAIKMSRFKDEPRKAELVCGCVLIFSGLVVVYSSIALGPKVILGGAFIITALYVFMLAAIPQYYVWYGPSESRLVLKIQEEIETAIENGITSGTFTYYDVTRSTLATLSRRMRGVGFGVSPTVIWRHMLDHDLPPVSHTDNL